jgi:galactokinase
LIGKGWGGSCFALTDDSFTDGMADVIAQAYEGVFHHRCKYYNVSAAQGAHILNI